MHWHWLNSSRTKVSFARTKFIDYKTITSLNSKTNIWRKNNFNYSSQDLTQNFRVVFFQIFFLFIFHSVKLKFVFSILTQWANTKIIRHFSCKISVFLLAYISNHFFLFWVDEWVLFYHLLNMKRRKNNYFSWIIDSD